MSFFVCPKCGYRYEPLRPCKELQHRCPKNRQKLVVLKEER